MRIHSDSFDHRGAIPAEFALGVREGDAVGFGRNRNPQLGWDGVPAGTRSFALLCIDTDAPTVAEMVNKDGVEIPVAQPRTEFCHNAVTATPGRPFWPPTQSEHDFTSSGCAICAAKICLTSDSRRKKPSRRGSPTAPAPTPPRSIGDGRC